MKNFIIYIIFCLFFIACSSNQTLQNIDNNLDFATTNKTTKEQVEILYGAPHRIIKQYNKEIWQYDFEKKFIFKKDIKTTSVFEFNEEEILINKYKIHK